jgi:hypothetical protein
MQNPIEIELATISRQNISAVILPAFPGADSRHFSQFLALNVPLMCRRVDCPQN